MLSSISTFLESFSLNSNWMWCRHLFVCLTDKAMEAHTRSQSRLWLNRDRDRTYLVSSPRHFPLEITAHADLASVGSPREGDADLSCCIRSSPSLMTLRVASRVAVCCCWNCLISSWTASTESAQTSSSISFCRSSIHVHSCVGESRYSIQGWRERAALGQGQQKLERSHILEQESSTVYLYRPVCVSTLIFITHLYKVHFMNVDAA